MKRSRSVSIVGVAALAAALTGACGSDEYETQQTAFGEVCMKYNRATGEYDVRVPDSECDNDPDRRTHTFVWINHGGGWSAPPVGSKLTPGSYSTVKPSGVTIARPPASGGFGTFRAPVGS